MSKVLEFYSFVGLFFCVGGGGGAGAIAPSDPLNPPVLPENPLEFWKNHKWNFQS
jgi:hypothetical protein